MLKTKKQVVFHIITIVSIVIIFGYTIDIFEVFKNNFAFGSIVKTLVSVVVAYFGIGQGVERLAIRYKRGNLHDYLQFLLLTYFNSFHLIKDPDLIDLGNGLTSLKKGIEDFCMDQISPDNYRGLQELKTLPYSSKKRITGNHEKVFATPLGISLTDYLAEYYKNSKETDGAIIFITGDPGAGKSYTLKQLTLSILKASEFLVPLYLPISTWRSDTSVHKWITKTAADFYMYGKKIEVIEALMDNKYKEYRTVLLLDGLDELEDSLIGSFTEQLMNENEIKFKNFVISTRTETFESLKGNKIVNAYQQYSICNLDEDFTKKVLLEQNNSIHLDSLYLNKDLFKQINSPLLIDLFLKVQEKITNDDLQSENFLGTLWDKYIHLVYQDKELGKHYSPLEKIGNGTEQNKIEEKNDENNNIKPVKFHFSESQLSLYSIQLAKRQDGEYFTIGELQPKILETKRERYLYALFTRLLIGIIISVGIGFLMSGPFDFLLSGLFSGFLAFCFFILPYKPLKLDKTFKDGLVNTSKYGMKSGFKALSGILIYFVITLIIMGLYFSASGLRRDMWQYLALADFIIGLFFAIMFTILCGVHDLKYGFSDDINLIEKEFIGKFGYFDLWGAIKFTAPFGLLTGLFVSISGISFSQNLPDNIFSKWLLETAQSWQIGLFPMIFWSVFPIAVVMGLMIGLNNPKLYFMESNEINNDLKAKWLPNYSISRTVLSSLYFSLTMTILLAILWSWVCMKLFQTGWDAGNRGIDNAIAVGIFIGLWWGWKDLIKLWILRLLLYFKGDTPLSYSKMLKDLEVLGVLKRIGARFKFTHQTLKDHYINTPKQSNIKKIYWMFPIVMFVLASVFCVRIVFRYKFYWNESSGISLQSKSNELKQISSKKVLVTEAGLLQIKSKGLIRAGRIMGSITPLGSETGFFGFPLKNSFDIYPNFRHGALMFQNSRDGIWKAVYGDKNIEFLANFPPLKWYTETILVNPSDTITFDINDLEWQNNSKEFNIELTLLPLPNSK